MKMDLDSELSSKLAKHQEKAVKMAIDYINNGKDNNIQAMVKMPTGSGKTGVMTVIADIFEESVLVISPTPAILDQLNGELTETFYKTIGYSKKFESKEIILIDDNRKFSKIDFKHPLVLIISIQRLLEWYNLKDDKEHKFNALASHIKLVLFDEGHQEPAPEWSKVNRAFECKKIIFTATPYRNDKNLFLTDPRYTSNYSLQAASEEGCICGVRFEAIPDELKDLDLMAKFITSNLSNDKIIVRLNDKERIRQLTEKINNYNRKDIAVGFHSDFDNNGNFRKYGKEINKYKTERTVFIHSDMLIEGLDIRELNCLIILDCFSNTKSFIQQIGRVIRKCKDKNEAVVYIPQNNIEYLKKQWELYIEHDAGSNNIDYVETEFRNRYDFEDNKFYEYLDIPRRATIYKSEESLFEELKSGIINKIKSQLDLFKKSEKTFTSEFITSLNYNFWIICYEKRIPSRFLRNNYYFNKSFELSVLLEFKIEEDDNDIYYIFYLDTSNFSIPKTSKFDLLTEINYSELCKLLPQTTDIRNAKFALASSIKWGTQTRNISGFKLNDLPGDTTEKLSYCKNIAGILPNEAKKIQRYINPIKSKISDSAYCDYKSYINWCANIVNSLKTIKNGNEYFKRYSSITEPLDQSPTSILIELDVTVKEYQDNKEVDEFYLDSLFIEVIDYRFEISLNKKIDQCKIIKTKSSKKNEIAIDYGEFKYFAVLEDNKSQDLVEYVNENHFRLYYKDKQIMYTAGYYFKPNIRTLYANPSDWPLFNNIKVLDDLFDCDNEKYGDKVKIINNWPKKSVFNAIVTYLRELEYIDYVICDDNGNEIADFIALSITKNCCYFIHCKHDTLQISGSNFQDVCGQALKNMQHLITNNYEELEYFEEHLAKFLVAWPFYSSTKDITTSTSDITVCRLVKFPPSDRPLKGKHIVENFSNELKKIMISEDGKKEVWLVHSGLSKKALENELTKDGLVNKQSEQVPHLFWLLQNTQDNFKQIGVELKIFCKE